MASLEKPVDLKSEPITSSTPHNRTQSASSNGASNPSGVGSTTLLSPPIDVSPEPMFIAASAASQIVTNDHDSRSNTWFDQNGLEPSGETALVSISALKLVNGFLDNLLFQFLSTSRSTSLGSLRPAVSEVLKPKLAQDAISGADQELQEYLGGGEDEELLAFHNGMEPSGAWDLELVWKRTRLRCMVYSSLGDMEEEDEDMYTEQEHLDGPPGQQNRFSNSSGVVSPAVAIFLTSILEYMGEQILIIAGQAAYRRLQAKYEREDRDGDITPVDIADRVVVDEMDMEKVIMDRTLGRLWRGWKKRIRSSNGTTPMSRSQSRETLSSRGQSRRASATETAIPLPEPAKEQISAMQVVDHEYAATIPLPEHENDVREIETPWLRIHPEDIEADTTPDSSDSEGVKRRPRPKSLMIFSNMDIGLPTPERSQPSSPTVLSPVSRKRAYSVPRPVHISSKKQKNVEAKKEGSVETTTDDVKRTEETNVEDPKAEKELDTIAAGEEVSTAQSLETDKAIVETVPSIKSQKEKESAAGVEAESAPEPIQTAQDVYENDDDNESEHESSHEKGLIAGVVAGAAAIGAAAVAGIAAAARGEAPQTNPEDSEAGEDPVEEEAEILTSSRVSIGGRNSPDNQVPLSRHSSVRSLSGRSLRLVDVAPRSPARSRHGSIDTTDYVSARNGLQRNGISPVTTDMYRVASPIQRASTASPTMRNATTSPITVARSGSAMSIRAHRHAAKESISEVDESPQEDSSADEKTPAVLALPDRSPLREAPAGFSQRARGLENRTSTIGVPSPLPLTSETVPGKRPEPLFVLQPAPSPRISREATPVQLDSDAPTQTTVSNITHSVLSFPSQGLMAPQHQEFGVPPLTPLREMMEGAPDTSDEASSIAPSLDDADASLSNYSPKSTHEKSFDFSQSPPRVATNEPIAPYSVVDMVRDDDITPKPEDHISKPARAVHTSASGSSIASNTKLKAMRTSEESAKSDKGRSFEELIHSDQTIQYTLTPQTMREIESPKVASFVVRNTPTTSAQSASISTSDALRPVTSASSVNRFTGLNSNPPPEMFKKQAVAASDTASPSKPYAQTGRPLSNSPATPRSGGPQARDARIALEPIDDFAEFIRSTGPPGQNTPPKTAPTVNGGQRGVSGINVGQRTSSMAAPRVPGPVPSVARSTSSATRNRLQAREAIVPYGGSSSELIDFIRQGPPNLKISSRVDNTQNPRYSQASTEVSVQPSQHSSVTSQSALLKNYKPAAAKPLQSQGRDMLGDDGMDGMMPKRKTRRVRDPYAIDLSDEEDEFDVAPTPKKPVRAEESLIDFLNNAPPPPPQPTAPFELSKHPAERPPIGQKRSSRSLASRFSRRESTSSDSQQPPRSSQSGKSFPATKVNNVAPQIPPAHTPIAAKYAGAGNSPGSYGVGAGSRGPDYGTTVANERAGGRVQQKAYQPREPVLEGRKQRSATDELAEFLMNTPPPPQKDPEPLMLSKDRGSAGRSGGGGGFSSMFGRKKKLAAA